MDLGYETAKGNTNAYQDIFGDMEESKDPLCEVCGGLKEEVIALCKCAMKLAQEEEDAMERMREERSETSTNE